MTDSPLFSAVARFLRHLGVERQLSPITLLNYQRQLDALIALADEAGLKSWSQCDAAQVRSFAVRSRRAGLGPASLALRLSALRSFFDWLVGQGELSANPAKGIAAPKIPRHLPKNIDVDDVNRLLDIDLNDPLAVRDRAMLEVMYGAGLRLSELVNLDIKHLDLESGEVWVMGKAAKSAVYRSVATRWHGLSTGWICAACSVPTTTRCFCRSWANVFRRATYRSDSPSGALSRG